MVVFFFNDTATTEIYTLSLHDALPIFCKLFNWRRLRTRRPKLGSTLPVGSVRIDRKSGSAGMPRPISYAVFCLKKKKNPTFSTPFCAAWRSQFLPRRRQRCFFLALHHFVKASG